MKISTKEGKDPCITQQVNNDSGLLECRGMGSIIKENARRVILAKEIPDILMIHETKTNNQETRNVKKKFRNYEGEVI